MDLSDPDPQLCFLKRIITLSAAVSGSKLLHRFVQGGSDISGTLSKLHCRIKNQLFLLIFSR